GRPPELGTRPAEVSSRRRPARHRLARPRRRNRCRTGGSTASSSRGNIHSKPAGTSGFRADSTGGGGRILTPAAARRRQGPPRRENGPWEYLLLFLRAGGRRRRGAKRERGRWRTNSLNRSFGSIPSWGQRGQRCAPREVCAHSQGWQPICRELKPK